MISNTEAIPLSSHGRGARRVAIDQPQWVAMVGLAGLLLSMLLVVVTQDWSQPMKFTGLE